MSNQDKYDFSGANSLPDLLRLLKKESVPEKDYWIYLGKYQERKARESGIPLHGTFELTPLCNLDCKMCYVHLNSNQVNNDKQLTVEQWKNIINKAHSVGMLNATLTGGECLIYPGFDELYLFLRGLGIKTSIKTNGVLLTSERIEFFNKYPPRGVTISLYGSSNEAYKRVTGYEAFEIVYNNLKQLKKASFPISISITPSSYMYEDMDNLLNFCKQLGYPFSVNIALFQPRKETGREICDLSSIEYAEIFKELQSVVDSPSESYEDYRIANDDNKQTGSGIGIRCGAGRSCFTVTWDGNISGCDNLNSLRINLHDEDFSSAWKIISTEANSYQLPIECNGCKYDKVCFSCVAYRSNGSQKGHCNKSVCDRTELFVKEGIYKL